MTAANNWALRHSIGIAILLLVAASVALTLGFACAVPLAAFATISALLFSRRAAVVAILSVWLANQAVGFCVMNYPVDFRTIAWGLALGGIALASTGAAAVVLSRLRSPAGLGLALVAGFVVYQGAIIAILLATGGDISYFGFAGLSRIFAINAAAFAGFLAFRAIWSRTAAGRTFEAALSFNHA
ncbi:MAG: hypothetical protein ACLPIC_01145 [Rhodoblastus sp.]|uniref:hypothetical protein n=1 Tax=Rhodoblastus sp. TaxID=1962975 RepID=UPI003F9A8D82